MNLENRISEKDFMAGMGKRIKMARINKGFTQLELAKLLGVSLPTIRAYEIGKVNIPAWNLARLCEHLNMDYKFVIDGGDLYIGIAY